MMKAVVGCVVCLWMAIQALAFDPNPGAHVWETVVQNDGKILFSGYFTNVGSHVIKVVARVRPNGSFDSTFNPDADLNFNEALKQTDGRMLLVGRFTTLLGKTRDHVARLNADGSLDDVFTNGVGGEAYAVTEQADGKVLVGGDFTTVAGLGCQRIARFNTNGSVDVTFNTNGASRDVYCFAQQNDGKILVGGFFTNLDGHACSYFGRLDSTGYWDSAFTHGAGDSVSCMLKLPSGKIMVGGWFNTIEGQAHRSIARLNADGTVDGTFTNWTDGGVFDMALQPDGKLIIVGSFRWVNDQQRGSIARFTTNDTLDSTFTPGAGDWVKSVTLQDNGRIIVSGWFTNLCGKARNYLGRLMTDGTLDEGEMPRADFDGDGRSDYGCYDAAGIPGLVDPGQWYFMKSKDGFDASVSFGYAGTVSVIGDFDGDRIADFGCYDAAGIPGVVPPGKWYFMKSADGFDGSVTFGYAGTVPVVGDFDGDGTDDYGCYDAAGIPGVVQPGQWYFMKSTEGLDNSVTFGYAGTVPVVGDFDGDGTDDYGCYDAAGIPGVVQPGQWYFMKSTAGFDASVRFGYAGTVPVVGDFDGDGTDDYGCYDAAGIPGVVQPGQWYFMKSMAGFDGSVSFGYAGTVPVVGDFDGDGTDDYGCYDAAGVPGAASPGSWYLMKSTDGFGTETFGYAGTEPVVR